MATLIERAIGAARLDVATYEEVEHDPNALGQAMTVVAAAALASGVGSAAQQGMGLLGLAVGAAASLLGWFVWAGIVYLVGTKLLPAPDTKADLGQLLRTTGFSAAPGVLGVAGVVPGIGILVVAIAGLWQLVTMVVAVRQALDYPTTGRAIAVCLVGFVVYVLIGVVLVAGCVGGLQGGASSGAIG
jgi:hypothetical protein